MRLFEHPDFEQALLRAAAHHGFSEQFVEKDYYVTEILRIIAAGLGDKVLFVPQLLIVHPHSPPALPASTLL